MRVVVDAAPSLPSEPAFLHILTQKWAGTVFLAESAVEVLKNLEAHVESYKVNHLKRAHGMVQPEFNGFVDVGGGSDSGFEHGERLVAYESVYPGSDESRRLLHNHRFLVHALCDAHTGSHGLVRGLRRPHNLDKTHLRDGIKEMHADAALRKSDDVGKVGDGKRGSIAGKNGVGPGEFIEDREQLKLHFKFFRNGLDNQLGITNGLVDDAGGGNAREGRVPRRRTDFAAFHTFFEGFANPIDGLGEDGIVYIFEYGLETSESRGVGDATSHGSSADHGDRFHVHAVLLRGSA